jgi:hypothetical protein
VKGPSPLHALFDDLRDALERLDVPYAVMGGVAVSFWGLPHFTHDIDVAVGVSATDTRAFLEGLEGEGYIVPDPFRTGWTDRLAGTRTLVVKRFAGGHVWDVDVFLEESDFVRSVLVRRQLVDLDGRLTPLVSVEDLVLFKLLAWRDKDRGHLHDLLLVVGELDQAYLLAWADRLDVRDRLAEQWRRSGRELRP